MAVSFGSELRRLREARGWSQPQLGKLIGYSASYISHLEKSSRLPTPELADALDAALTAGGALVALAPTPALRAGPAGEEPWETAELVRRLELSDVGHSTVEKLCATAHRLCCEYSYRPATELRTEAHQWLRYVARLLRGSVSLNEHRDLLVVGGWLALLAGCLEHDLNMTSTAETTRAAASSLGTEAGHSEIVGWSWEMAAWMALTRNDPARVLQAARAGQEACHGHSVTGQLAGLEAKALARLEPGSRAIYDVLDAGHQLLTSLPVPDDTSSHFVVEPRKWEFLAMDVYRVAGDDQRAAEIANRVIERGTLPDGTALSPMRVSEARLTLAVAAARSGDLERAAVQARRALSIQRRSLPSLLVPVRELIAALSDRYPDVELARDLRHELRSVTAA